MRHTSKKVDIMITTTPGQTVCYDTTRKLHILFKFSINRKVVNFSYVLSNRKIAYANANKMIRILIGKVILICI